MPLPAIAALGGGLLSGLGSFFGQQSANAMNWDMFVSNQAFQQANINAARDYDYNMANTAYQRASKDMKAAGLNPMLMMSQGGAGGGSSPITSGGTGPAMENAIGPGVSAAMQAVNLVNDIKTADADRALKGAQAAQAAATATRETSNARLSDWQRAVIEATMGATKEKAKSEEMAGPIDRSYMATKKLLEVIAQGAGIAKDASFSVESIMNMIPQAKGMKTIQGLGRMIEKVR